MTVPSATSDTIVLEAGGSRVEIRPALGGSIGALRLGARDWLLRDAPGPSTTGPPGVANDGAGADGATRGGGYVECLPTVAACTVDVPGVGAVALPGGGELWTQHAATERLPDAAGAGAAAAVTRWAGTRLRYAFARTVTVGADGAVRMDYALTSEAAEPFPFLWSARARLAFPPDTRLDLPVAARVRVAAQHGVELGGELAEHRWPVLRVGSAGATPFGPREVDFTRPALAPRRFGDGGRADYACALCFDLPRGSAGRAVRLGVEQGGARLELEVDPGEVPSFALHLDHGGRPGARAVVFAPGLGVPDALDAALGRWGGAQWLAPGETRRWALTWRGRAAPVS